MSTTTTGTTEPTSYRVYPRESWFDGDPFTMGEKLCDDDGIVRSDPRYPFGYQCTGHAHKHGDHIECLSEAHVLPPLSFPVMANPLTALPANDGYACLRIARELREMLLLAQGDDEETKDMRRTLLADADAIERVGRWLTTAKPVLSNSVLNTFTFVGGTPAAGPWFTAAP